MKSWTQIQNRVQILLGLGYTIDEYGSTDGTVIKYSVIKLAQACKPGVTSMKLQEETFWIISTTPDGETCISASACSEEDALKEAGIMANVLRIPV